METTQANKSNAFQWANEAFVDDLKKVLTIPPEVLAQLAGKLNTKKGIGLRDEDADEVWRIWAKTKLPVENLGDAISALRYVFTTGLEKELLPDAILDELAKFCRARDLTGLDERIPVLRKFLTPRPGLLKYEKLKPYAKGVERNLESISGTVQLRAAFEDKEATALIGYVPVVVVRLSTQSDREDDDREDIVFQTTENGLAKLISHLQTYQKQLKAMKEDLGKKAAEFDEPETTRK
jgi:hypothetical protein